MLALVAAFALGVAVGRNWPKIKERIKPLLAYLEKQYGDLSFSGLEALARHKEKFEDLISERRPRKHSRRAARK